VVPRTAMSVSAESASKAAVNVLSRSRIEA
jgi:hypothetical protein